MESKAWQAIIMTSVIHIVHSMDSCLYFKNRVGTGHAAGSGWDNPTYACGCRRAPASYHGVVKWMHLSCGAIAGAHHLLLALPEPPNIHQVWMHLG